MKCGNCHKVGLALSALLHLSAVGAFVISRTEAPSTPADKVIPVKLAMFQAQPPAPPAPLTEPAPEPQPEPPPPAPKPPKPKVERKPDPPRPAKQATPSPPTPPPQPVALAAVESPPPVAAPPAPVPQAPTASPEERQRYLAQLLNHIERSKFYPASARRRGLQGVVKVSFVLLADGGIRDLAVSGEHGILESAAAEAIHKAQPLPKPPPGIECPHHMEFGMEFKLH